MQLGTRIAGSLGHISPSLFPPHLLPPQMPTACGLHSRYENLECDAVKLTGTLYWKQCEPMIVFLQGSSIASV